MAMAFAVLGLIKGHVSVKNPKCTEKSYPFFFQDVEHIVHSSRPIAIVGMRGAGKTGLGKRLASKLKLKFVDSDKKIVEQVGPLKDFIAAKGWPAFRALEESVIRHCLQTPGIVLACGGGATETPGVRAVLKELAVVVWLQAQESALVERLKSGKRPSLTALPVHEEVKKLVTERTPNYREVATIDIPAHLPFPRQVLSAVASLTKRLRSYDFHTRSHIA
jgi:shikimate kinase